MEFRIDFEEGVFGRFGADDGLFDGPLPQSLALGLSGGEELVGAPELAGLMRRVEESLQAGHGGEDDGFQALVKIGVEAVSDRVQLDTGNVDYSTRSAGQPGAVHNHDSPGVFEATRGIAGPIAPLIGAGLHLVYAGIKPELGDDVEALRPRVGVKVEGTVVRGDLVFVEDDRPGDDGESIGVSRVVSGQDQVAVDVKLEGCAGHFKQFGPGAGADFRIAAGFPDKVLMPADGGHGAPFEKGKP